MRLSDQEWSVIARLEDLAVFSFENMVVDRGWLSRAKSLPSAISLRLSKVSLEGEWNPSWLGRMKSVQHVDLTNVNISKAEFLGLKDLREIRRLILSGTPATDEWLMQLPAYGSLESLEAAGPWISDRIAPWLAMQKSLESLHIGGHYVGDDIIKSVVTLPKIVELGLDDTQVTDTGMKWIAKSSIEKLRVANTSITRLGIGHLASSKRITSLRLSGCRVTDEMADLFVKMESLVVLSVDRTMIGLPFVRSMAKSQTLRLLQARDNGLSRMDLVDILTDADNHNLEVEYEYEKSSAKAQ